MSRTSLRIYAIPAVSRRIHNMCVITASSLNIDVRFFMSRLKQVVDVQAMFTSASASASGLSRFRPMVHLIGRKYT